jgi:WD40 repeat protein
MDVDLRKTRGDKFDKFLYTTWKPDGREMSIVTRGDFVHAVDIANGGIVGTIQPGNEVYSVIYDNRDRQWVATGGTPGKIQIYSNSELESEMVAHAHSTTALGRSGRYIVSGGNDALIAVWDSDNMKCIRTLPESISPVTTLACNGELVAWGSGGSGSKDGESVLSIGGIHNGYHYVSHSVSAPVSRVRWHPTRMVLAYSTYGASGDSNVSIMSFPSLD